MRPVHIQFKFMILYLWDTRFFTRNGNGPMFKSRTMFRIVRGYDSVPGVSLFWFAADTASYSCPSPSFFHGEFSNEGILSPGMGQSRYLCWLVEQRRTIRNTNDLQINKLRPEHPGFPQHVQNDKGRHIGFRRMSFKHLTNINFHISWKALDYLRETAKDITLVFNLKCELNKDILVFDADWSREVRCAVLLKPELYDTNTAQGVENCAQYVLPLHAKYSVLCAFYFMFFWEFCLQDLLKYNIAFFGLYCKE